MKRLFIVFVFFNFFSANAIAEIVYIDINYILNSSEVGKLLNNHISKINNEYKLKYKNLESKIILKEQSLIAQKNILEKNEFEKQASSLSKEIKKFRSDKKISIDKINQIKLSNTKKILNLLNPIITKYVNENSITLVIPKKNIIVGKKNLDITKEILELLNNDVKTLDF